VTQDGYIVRMANQ